MNEEISAINERITNGGDWMEIRKEIAELHAQATREGDYVALLAAHHRLVASGGDSFDADTYEKIRRIAHGEYLSFLNKESLENDVINPAILGRVTSREVEAGRLKADDDFRTFADSAAIVLGDSAELYAHRCKHGDYFFYGVAASAVFSSFLTDDLSVLWLIVVGLVAGWYINEREQKRSKAEIAQKRSS